MLLYGVIPIKMATCPLGRHSKSHLITPHCVLHYTSLAVNTTHFVDSNSVDSLPNRITELKHNRLKGSKLDELIHLFLEFLSQSYYYPYAVVSRLLFIYVFFYCCSLIPESLQVCLLICAHYFCLISCCLFHICECAQFLPLLQWHSCSDIPGLSN